MELYNKGLALQQKGDYVASEEAYNQLLNSALVKEVSTLIFKMVFYFMFVPANIRWHVILVAKVK